MSGAPSSPMLRAAGLWRKTSAAGREYFVGRLGGVKITILSNRGRGEDESQPTHHLYFAEAAERSRQGEAGERPRQQVIPPAPAPRRGPPYRPPVRPDSVPMSDDPIDDIGRGGR